MIFLSRELFPRVLSLIMLVGLILFQNPVLILALSPEQKELYDQNILYYDLECGAPSQQSPSTTTSGDISSVYMRGDSITYGADQYYDLEGKFKDKGIEATATGSGGGTVSRPGSTGDDLSGLDAMDKDKEKVKDVDGVVVAYGTNNYNEPASTMKSEISKMVSKIKSINDSAQIFWVNIKIEDKSNMDKINQVIEDQSSKEGYTVIDFASSSIPLGDAFHPAYSEEGFGKWGELVTDAVAEGSSASNSSSSQSLDACCGGSSGSVESGKGEPEGTQFPDLDPASMAKAIDDFIQKTKPNSKLAGLGETIVAGAEHSNISPFLIVAHAHAESDLADPGMYNIIHGNNAFGRTATTEQPNFQGDRLWYKWSSVEASVDYEAPENKGAVGGGDIASYIREQYPDVIDKGDLDTYLLQYVADGNESWYKSLVKGDVKEMANASSGSNSSSGTPSEAAVKCCAGGTSSTLLAGRNNEEKIWNYLVSELGLDDQQAAGVLGNMQQESGFNPEATNPDSGAYGIAQWYAERKTGLTNFAQSEGKQVNDLGVQLDYLKKELNSTYKSTVLEPLLASDSLSEATRIWLEEYEVPCTPGSSACDAEMNTRMPFSEHWLDVFGGGGASSDPSTSSANCESGTGESTGEFIWPVDKQYQIGSCYGWRPSTSSFHSGLDLFAPRGTKVVAADGGKVEQATDTGGGFGNAVVIKHDNGKWTLYAHLLSFSVKEGDVVDQGQEIGKVDSTGRSFGDHLHFNVQTAGGEQGSESGTVDPRKFLPDDGRAVTGSNC